LYNSDNAPFAHHYYYDVWGNTTQRIGWGGANASYTATYAGNRRVGDDYDPAGNIISDGGQSFSYDATGQQSYASGTGLSRNYDGDGLRVKKTEHGRRNCVCVSFNNSSLSGTILLLLIVSMFIAALPNN
jgi:hypothetical protein